jgi:hypothetical protein
MTRRFEASICKLPCKQNTSERQEPLEGQGMLSSPLKEGVFFRHSTQRKLVIEAKSEGEIQKVP